MSRFKPVFEQPITYPEMLTGNALKILQGELTNNLTDDDWEAYLQYCERVEIVDKIVTGIANQFPH